ncbi:MAG: type IV toxin-antitoxin system AbiEi family antitoxin domain-containing protein [Myxococcota bacterium]|nr:type IV toxin-antitoxin system AbiEi family antitoxin domain-containing protein [Myxococcota bacterium]
MGDAAWKALEVVAARQSGLVTRGQALGAGIAGKVLERWIRAGAVRTMHRGLYRVAGASDPGDRELRAALLLAGPESVLSHRTAAKAHRLWGIDGCPLEVTVPRRTLIAVPGLTIHRARLSAEDRGDVAGLAVTSVRRTLWDLAPHVDIVTLAALFEAARKKDRDLLATTKEWLRTKRHRLPPELGQAIDLIVRDCESRERPFDSHFEVAFWHRWLFNGLDRPVPQLKVRDRAGNMYIDFAFPNEKVAVETQGYELRDTRGSFDYDASRTLRLGPLGWQVIPVTKTMFREAFPAVVEQIEGTRRSRR